jgi:hypothetical protein
MNIAYPLLVQEDVAQLQAAEKAARDKARADRLRLLRFLKEERVAGVSQAAGVLNRVQFGKRSFLRAGFLSMG